MVGSLLDERAIPRLRLPQSAGAVVFQGDLKEILWHSSA
jgi:hypothetical protein